MAVDANVEGSPFEEFIDPDSLAIFSEKHVQYENITDFTETAVDQVEG